MTQTMFGAAIRVSRQPPIRCIAFQWRERHVVSFTTPVSNPTPLRFPSRNIERVFKKLFHAPADALPRRRIGLKFPASATSSISAKQRKIS